MKGFPKVLKTKEDYYNCLAMVASGELAAADLLAKIVSAENQRYIECGVAAVEEEKKAVTVYYCDEAAVGMKFVAGDVSGTVQGVTHIQTDEAAAAGEAGNDRTALTLSKAVKAGCKVIALERTDTVAGMTTDDIAALKGVLKQYEYACRKGKGMHAASDTLKEWLYEWNKYHPDQPLYAIKADIHHYFQSIDHAVLKTEIRKVIKDAGVLALLDRIIDHNGNMPDGVGIPVGNLTSQLFANIYLDALDQFIKHELGVEAYIRYMDDFVILSPDKEQLRNWLARIEQFLREELKLEFNPKTTMLAAKNGIDFVGYKHRATHRKVRKDSIKRIKRTIKKCESGKITKEQLQKSIQSWTGHAGHADSYNLRKKIETLAEAAIEKAA